jgi:hypothetical protein
MLRKASYVQHAGSQFYLDFTEWIHWLIQVSYTGIYQRCKALRHGCRAENKVKN